MDVSVENLGIKCAVANCNARTISKINMLSHYRVVHRGDPLFDVPCFVCDKRYKTEDALRKHLKKPHATFFEETLDIGAVAASDEEQHEEEIFCQNPSPMGSPSISSTEELVVKPPNYDSALYLLHLSTERKFNQVDLQTVMKAKKDLVNTYVNSVLTKINSSLQEAECSHIEIIQHMQQLYRSSYRLYYAHNCTMNRSFPESRAASTDGNCPFAENYKRSTDLDEKVVDVFMYKDKRYLDRIEEGEMEELVFDAGDEDLPSVADESDISSSEEDDESEDSALHDM